MWYLINSFDFGVGGVRRLLKIKPVFIWDRERAIA